MEVIRIVIEIILIIALLLTFIQKERVRDDFDTCKLINKHNWKIIRLLKYTDLRIGDKVLTYDKYEKNMDGTSTQIQKGGEKIVDRSNIEELLLGRIKYKKL